jgi:hypothetical protein
MRIALEVGAVRLAPHHDLVGQHVAFRRGERNRAVLLDKGDRHAAGLEQTEDVGRGRRRQAPLVRNDVVFGAVAGGDVILGEDRHQIGIAFDEMNGLGLALGDLGANGRLNGITF